MIRTLLFSLLAAAAAQAETLKEAVSARRPRLQDPAEILAELVAPSSLVVTNQVLVVKEEGVVAWEQYAASKMIPFVLMLSGTNEVEDAAATARNLKDYQMIQAADAYLLQHPEHETMVFRKTLEMLTLLAGAKERGYSWPLPEDFGSPFALAEEVATVQGPAWWEQVGMAGPPSLEDVTLAIVAARTETGGNSQ